MFGMKHWTQLKKPSLNITFTDHEILECKEIRETNPEIWFYKKKGFVYSTRSHFHTVSI